MGDSILPQIYKEKLCKIGTMKVQYFPGAKFDYFYHYAIPVINKKPDWIVLHMGTKNVPYCMPEKMVDQTLGLKNLSCRNSQPVWDYYFYSNAKDR